jgi:hypothetical protein
MLNLCVFHLVGSACHVIHSAASGHESLMHYFSCSGGTGTDLTKSAPGHVMPNMCFFCIRWDLRVTLCISVHPDHEKTTYYFSCSGGTSTDLKKAQQDTLRRTCVFASGGICRSHMHFGASGARNIDALFSCPGGNDTDLTKSTSGHVMPNLCFWIRWDLQVT